MTTQEFASFVETYRDQALSLAIRLLKDVASAEDAVQDSFVKAHRGISAFRADAELSTWFYRIVYTTCLNVLRSQRRMPKFESLNEESAFVSLDVDVHDSMDRDLLLNAVGRVLENMSPLYAVVMDLFYIKDCRYEEIVKVTGLPLGTVKARLNRGRLMLKEALESEFRELKNVRSH